MAFNKFMHPRNIYKVPADFKSLAEEYPEFRKFAMEDSSGKVHLNFKDAASLKALTTTLLRKDFGLDVDMPADHLVPALPSRLNYIHWLEDLLQGLYVEPGRNVRVLDIGTGPCCIYALLGTRINDWHFVGTDICEDSIKVAKDNITKNKLDAKISVVRVCEGSIFKEALESVSGNFDFSMCNPPFFRNEEEADSMSKNRSGERDAPRGSGNGEAHEKVTEGGELEFVQKMILESKKYGDRVRVFSTMVGCKKNFLELKTFLEDSGVRLAQSCRTEFCQGRTMRWGLAWTWEKKLQVRSIPIYKRTKEKPPLRYNVPDILKTDVMSFYEKVKSFLDELEIEQEELKVDKRLVSVRLLARANTWSYQREKRRAALREATEEEGAREERRSQRKRKRRARDRRLKKRRRKERRKSSSSSSSSSSEDSSEEDERAIQRKREEKIRNGENLTSEKEGKKSIPEINKEDTSVFEVDSEIETVSEGDDSRSVPEMCYLAGDSSDVEIVESESRDIEIVDVDAEESSDDGSCIVSVQVPSLTEAKEGYEENAFDEENPIARNKAKQNYSITLERNAIETSNVCDITSLKGVAADDNLPSCITSSPVEKKSNTRQEDIKVPEVHDSAVARTSCNKVSPSQSKIQVERESEDASMTASCGSHSNSTKNLLTEVTKGDGSQPDPDDMVASKQEKATDSTKEQARGERADEENVLSKVTNDSKNNGSRPATDSDSTQEPLIEANAEGVNAKITSQDGSSILSATDNVTVADSTEKSHIESKEGENVHCIPAKITSDKEIGIQGATDPDNMATTDSTEAAHPEASREKAGKENIHCITTKMTSDNKESGSESATVPDDTAVSKSAMDSTKEGRIEASGEKVGKESENVHCITTKITSDNKEISSEGATDPDNTATTDSSEAARTEASGEKAGKESENVHCITTKITSDNKEISSEGATDPDNTATTDSSEAARTEATGEKAGKESENVHCITAIITSDKETCGEGAAGPGNTAASKSAMDSTKEAHIEAGKEKTAESVHYVNAIGDNPPMEEEATSTKNASEYNVPSSEKETEDIFPDEESMDCQVIEQSKADECDVIDIDYVNEFDEELDADRETNSDVEMVQESGEDSNGVTIIDQRKNAMPRYHTEKSFLANDSEEETTSSSSSEEECITIDSDVEVLEDGPPIDPMLRKLAFRNGLQIMRVPRPVEDDCIIVDNPSPKKQRIRTLPPRPTIQEPSKPPPILKCTLYIRDHDGRVVLELHFIDGSRDAMNGILMFIRNQIINEWRAKNK